MKAVLITGFVIAILCTPAWSAQATAAQESRSTTPSSTTPSSAERLHAATLQGEVDTIRRLVKAGADLNKRDAYGSTPLLIAATFGRAEAAQALIDAGADLNLWNNEGSTALHVAAFFGRTEIVRVLLEKGANRYIRNFAGHSALESVTAPFAELEATYDRLGKALGPLGLTLDYAQIRRARPAIAQMLRPGPEELKAVEFEPLPGRGWKVATPAQLGLDPTRIAELYLDASGLRTLYGMLVVKNGHLIAEKYFNQGGIDKLSGRQSMTKSVTSAMVGIALDQGCLKSVDQKMIEFFPELAPRTTDPRKRQITIRHLLQMRAGYPWEEREPPYFENLYLRGDWHWLPHIVDFPLTSDPGAQFKYSNLTSHLLAVIVARACKTDLQSFAQKHLFAPIGAKVHRWTGDPNGYNWGWGEIYLTARDMAKFGLLYLARGSRDGKQLVAADYVRDSLQRYSEHINFTGTDVSEAGHYFRDLGYGYQWWSARAGDHRFDYAWGHGGQLVVLLHDLDMIIVTTADPLHHLPSSGGWIHEGTIIDVVGKFIASLPPQRGN